jgi:chaperonin GroEL
MPKRNLVRKIIKGDEVQQKIKAGIDQIFDVALASYGVSSGNVMIEHRYGEPLISHDGITNIGKLVLEDPIENAAVSIVRQASEKTNRDAGDSTTLTVLLTKFAYNYWSKFESVPPRIIQARMLNFAEAVRQDIQKSSIAVTDETLRGVSRISAGDEALGDLVHDAVKKVGGLGGVTVVEVPEPFISSEEIAGFTFKKGLKAIALANDMQTIKSRYDDPAIVIMSKLLSKNDEIVPVLDKVLRAGHSKIVLIADVSGQALETIISNKIAGKIDIAIVEPPMVDRDVFLNDVAAYSSTKQYSGSAEDFEVDDFVGTAESVYITLSETTINGVKDKEVFEAYTKEISDKKRLDQLNGKTVKISVGAPTQAERQELKLRIEDAVCAAQTAQEHGVLPGGGVFLRDYRPDEEISYLNKPYEWLTAGVVGIDVKGLKTGQGIDIFSNKIVDDMVAAGIVDSAKAIEEAVINSHSAAAQLISVRLALPYVEDME